MSPKKKAKKKLGTNEESIARAEQKLGIRYPGLIREMLKERNEFFWGAYRFFGVLDDEDKYHTFDDVVRENNNPVAGWAKYLPKGFVCIANQDNNCLLLNKNKDGKVYSYDHGPGKLSVFAENEDKLSYLLRIQDAAIAKELREELEKQMVLEDRLFNQPAKQKYFIKLLIHSYTKQSDQVVLLFHKTSKLLDINLGEIYCSKVNPGETLKQVLDKEIKSITGSSEYEIMNINDDGTDFDRSGSEITRYALGIKVPFFDVKGKRFKDLGGSYMSWVMTDSFGDKKTADKVDSTDSHSNISPSR